MIFFAALSASKLGKEIGWKVESFGKNVFQTMPILPIGWWVGIGSAAKVLWWVPDRWVADRTRAQEKIVSDYVYGEDKTPPTVLTGTQTDNIITKIQTNPDAAKKYLETEKIVPSTLWTTDNTVLYNSLNKVLETSNTTPADKTTFINNADVVLGAGWYKTQATAAVTNNAIIKTIKSNTSEADISKTLNNGTPKGVLGTYFNNVTPKPTEIKITTSDWKTLKITQTSNTTTPYTWVIELTTP